MIITGTLCWGVARRRSPICLTILSLLTGVNEYPLYGSLKLDNPAGSYGSLHVFDGYVYHPVCDHGFGWNELTVACRQLGYTGAIQVINNSM